MAGVTTRVNRLGCDVLTIRPQPWGRLRERSVRFMDGIGAGAVYGVHTSSLKNVARGIVERVFYVVRDGELSPPPRPGRNVFKRLDGVRARLMEHLTPTTVVPRREYPSLYSGRKRVVYEKAVESLVWRGIQHTDAIVSTFVKAEKINLSSKPDPAPRVIQPRSARYNVEVGRYLKLFEKRLVRGFRDAFGYNVILKGLNASEVATALRENWDNYRDPVAIGLDASRFDQHVSADALRYEHSVYNGVFRSPELARLLSWQIHNTGVARVNGYRVDYKVTGCRMSGDINTGMGNCLLMSMMVLAYLQDQHVDARLSNNGDDCVLILERKQLDRLAGIEDWFLDLGFTLVREPVVEVFEKVVFCQAQPVFTSTGWRMVRDPLTAPSKDSVSLLSWDTPMHVRRWCHAIGSCGLELTRGVPFWQAYYSSLLAHGVQHGVSSDFIRDSGLGYMAKGVVGGDITGASRVSFYRAFGMIPDVQVALEQPFSIDLKNPKRMTIRNRNIQHSVDDNPIATWARVTRLSQT